MFVKLEQGKLNEKWVVRVFCILKKFHKDNLDLCVISMIPDNETNSYGKLKFENKKLIGIVENSEITNDKHSNICNSGIMIFKTKRLIENLKLIKNKNKKKEYFLTDLVEIFKKKNLFKISIKEQKI